jgi:hypothetical protein
MLRTRALTLFAREPWAIQRPRASQDVKKPTPRFPDLEFSSAECPTCAKRTPVCSSTSVDTRVPEPDVQRSETPQIKKFRLANSWQASSSLSPLRDLQLKLPTLTREALLHPGAEFPRTVDPRLMPRLETRGRETVRASRAMFSAERKNLPTWPAGAKRLGKQVPSRS